MTAASPALGHRADTLRRSTRLDVLQLSVLPTEACNFRCRYCYESFAHGRMPAAVVRGLKALLAERAGTLRFLSLSWFGGEPLLAKDVVLDVMRHVRALRALHPLLRVRSDMTTNGWHLERDLFAELVDLGVRTYMISFDGPPELHDQKRVRADGGPTFDRIWRNVAAMRAVDGPFDVRVRLHVDRKNPPAIADFFDRFARTFGGDPRFRLMVRELSRLGGPGDPELDTLDDDAAAAIGALHDDVRGRGLPLYDATADAAVCHASRFNAFVIRADGRVGKCTVALDRDENVVGRLHEDGRLELVGPRLEPWLRGLLSERPDELRCPATGWLGEEPSRPRNAAASSPLP